MVKLEGYEIYSTQFLIYIYIYNYLLYLKFNPYKNKNYIGADRQKILKRYG